MREPRGSGPGPGREPLPEPDDIPWAEAVTSEDPIGHPVQLPACISEVTVLQAGIQPLGEPDQLLHAVVLQGGRGINEIAGLYATREGARVTASSSSIPRRESFGLRSRLRKAASKRASMSWYTRTIVKARARSRSPK